MWRILPDLIEIAEDRERLFDRRVVVGVVALVEVDGLDLQAAQAVFDGAGDVRAGEALAVGALPHLAADLRGDDDAVAVAARLHPAADDLLRHAAGVVGRPAAVDVGGVDEVAAGGDVARP